MRKPPRKYGKWQKRHNTPFALTAQREKFAYLEDDMQCRFAQTLRDWQKKGEFANIPGLEYFEFCAIPRITTRPKNEQEETAAIILGQHNKRRGYKKGWFDITVIYKFAGKSAGFGLIELKESGGVVSESQEELRAAWTKHQIPHGIAYAYNQAMAIMKEWGLVPPAYSSWIAN